MLNQLIKQILEYPSENKYIINALIVKILGNHGYSPTSQGINEMFDGNFTSSLSSYNECVLEDLLDSTSFSEGVPIEDPELIQDVKEVLETKYFDGITKMLSVNYDAATSKFTGIFEDVLENPLKKIRIVKRYEFFITPDDISYSMVNNPKIPPGFDEEELDNLEFFEASFDNEIEFAAKKKGTKKCVKGIPCGSSCQRRTIKRCGGQPLTAQQKALVDKLNKKAMVAASNAKASNKTKTAKPQASPPDKKTLNGNNITNAIKDPNFKYSQDLTASEANKLLKEARKNKDKASINSESAFSKEIDKAFDKIDKEDNADGLVPIWRLRRELGDRVSREEFNNWLLELQSKDKFQLMGGSVPDGDPQKIKDSVETELSGVRTFMKRI